MAKKLKDGGPAFPNAPALPMGSGDDRHGETGMSLRDWFAGQALSGLLADSEERPDDSAGLSKFIREIADGAYEFADAMLAARAA